MSKETTSNENQGTGSGPIPPGTLISTGVSFGTANGGPCLGKGMCRLHAQGPATKVNFTLSGDKETLTLAFSMSELKTYQPDQVAYFQDPSHEYPFDVEYILDDRIFVSLGVLPNAKVSPTSPTKVAISGDRVELGITYDHN